MGILNILADFPAHLLTMLLLLGASAYFSACETSIFNLSREQLRRFRASKSPFRQLTARLMDDPRHVLVSVLFGNLVVNTAFFVMGVVLIDEIHQAHPEASCLWGVLIGVLTPLAIIVAGEIIPKSIAAAMPERIAPMAGLPLTAIGYVARPVRIVLGYMFVVPITRLVTGARRQQHSFVTTDELQAIIEVAAREGAVTVQEGDMLADVLDLGQLRVREVMTPRVEIIGCDRVTPMAIVLTVFRRTRHSKMVVYEDDMDHIAGVVYAKTAFLNPDRSLSELLRPVCYVPETKPVEGLLKDFRARKIQFAVAVDEFGGVAGIVTLEDCMAQIVGEIPGEADRAAVEPVQRVGEAEYLLAGDLSIRSWADSFDLEVPEEGGRYSTVAGFVTDLLGRMPRPGDTAEWRNLQFVVEEVKRRRVTRVRLRLSGQTPGAPAGQGAEPK